MAEFVLSAFADEAGSSIEEQITALVENGIHYIEPRNFFGKGILALSDEELSEIKKSLDAAKIKVNSLGSPIGKYPITEPLENHLKDFLRAIEICKIFDTQNMRMFSFFIPQNEDPKKYSDDVIRRLKVLADIAKANGITLNHENEKNIFGQNPEEVDFIADNLPEIKLIFDGANYRMCGCNVDDGINASLKNFGYFHVKDAIFESQTIVPVGHGEANYEHMLEVINERFDSKIYLTLEPHLHIFDAFKDIDHGELRGKYSFKTNREAFDFAANALKNLLTKNGYKEFNGAWTK